MGKYVLFNNDLKIREFHDLNVGKKQQQQKNNNKTLEKINYIGNRKFSDKIPNKKKTNSLHNNIKIVYFRFY